ncbi:uncharacterized protein LOC134205946 [Armigeres subalbatus]|uniref:uncharacterized protein LOC134205946 n=1 Tax=Armigeres subalbatus TaxID=124917 RepID=UPI002ED47956
MCDVYVLEYIRKIRERHSNQLIVPFYAIADNDSEQISADDDYYVVCTEEGSYKIQEKPTVAQPRTPKPRNTAPSPVRVSRIRGGFVFPITSGSDLERLEQAVTNRKDIRQEYVALLSRKPKNYHIANYMQCIFSDEALDDYNYHGVHVLGRCKIAMKGYDIFSNCFLDAFKSDGLTMEELSEQIVLAIKQSRNRMRQRTFRAKKIIKKMLMKKSEN